MTYQFTRLPDRGETCTCCGRLLRSTVVMLELDQRDQSYHQRGDVPSERSQGWFPFGRTCADRLIKKQRGS